MDHNTLDEQTIASWTESELIGYLHHMLQQKVTKARGLAMMLANGSFGFTSAQQQKVIEHLHSAMEHVTQTQQHLATWIIAHYADPEDD